MEEKVVFKGKILTTKPDSSGYFQTLMLTDEGYLDYGYSLLEKHLEGFTNKNIEVVIREVEEERSGDEL